MRTVKLMMCTALAVAALVSAPAFAQSGAAGTGLAGTLHDFATPGANPANGDTNTALAGTTGVGLCTFCHTPHKAQSTQLLWNHTLSTNNFSWSDASTTTGGTPLTQGIKNTYKGASVRCLSCHDGSVAIGDVSWFREQPWPAASPLNPDKMGVAPLVGVSDPMEYVITGTPGSNDLKGNHPIGVPFPYGNAIGHYNTATTGAAVNVLEWQANPQALDIRLFTDPDNTGTAIVAGATPGKTGIECSSCHDPHNGATVKEDLFVRGTLGGADTQYICLKCHKK